MYEEAKMSFGKDIINSNWHLYDPYNDAGNVCQGIVPAGAGLA